MANAIVASYPKTHSWRLFEMLTSAKIVSQSSHRKPSFMLVLARNLKMTATVGKIQKMIAKAYIFPDI